MNRSPDRQKTNSPLLARQELGSSFGRTKIGLFGGSFNPAHSGHVDLTNEALKRLKLDAVWWLVSPLNPLKSQEGMADLAPRLEQARLVAPSKKVTVTAFEQQLKTRYTVETIDRLQSQFPGTKFVWLMGADNLATIDHWKDWTKLVESIPIAVFDRAPFSMTASRSKMAIRYKDQRRKENIAALVQDKAPSWAYIFMPRNSQSATALRKSGDWPTE